MELITIEQRAEELLRHGIPKDFLINIGKIEQLQFLVEKPDSAYSYLPSISEYRILNGFRVIPIYTCGEIFYVFRLSYDEQEKRIIKFELEQDEIYADYETNWDLLLLEILIDFFDFNIEDGLNIDEFETVGRKLGFSNSRELFNLRNLSIEEYNVKFEDDKKWRKEIAIDLEIL